LINFAFLTPPNPRTHLLCQAAERELDLLTRTAGRADHQLQQLQSQLLSLRQQHPHAAAAVLGLSGSSGLPIHDHHVTQGAMVPAAAAAEQQRQLGMDGGGGGGGAVAAAAAEAALQVRLVAAEARRQLAEERCQDLSARVQVRGAILV
jgi:hypothetical protein